MKNIDILLTKANEFSSKLIDVKFMFEEQLEQLYFEFQELGVDSQTFLQPFITINNDTIQINLAQSTLQFAKAYLTFSRDLFKIHYYLINQTIVEALVELIKLHLKYYEHALQKLQTTSDKQLEIFIIKNVDFRLNYLFQHVDTLYRPKVGHSVKYFTKVYDKMSKLKEMVAS